MVNIHDKPEFYDVAAGSLLARYIKFVWRTSWQTRNSSSRSRTTKATTPASSACGTASSCCCR